MPEQRVARYTGEYGISAADAKVLTDSKRVSDLFENALKAYNNPKPIGTFIVVELMRRINLGELDLDNMKFTAEDLAKLIELAENGKYQRITVRLSFVKCLKQARSPKLSLKNSSCG